MDMDSESSRCTCLWNKQRAVTVCKIMAKRSEPTATELVVMTVDVKDNAQANISDHNFV